MDKPRALLSETEHNGREIRSAWIARTDAAQMLRTWRAGRRLLQRQIIRHGTRATIGRDYIGPRLVLRTFTGASK